MLSSLLRSYVVLFTYMSQNEFMLAVCEATVSKLSDIAVFTHSAKAVRFPASHCWNVEADMVLPSNRCLRLPESSEDQSVEGSTRGARRRCVRSAEMETKIWSTIP